MIVTISLLVSEYSDNKLQLSKKNAVYWDVEQTSNPTYNC
jgi:hypothetical protein